MGVVDLTGHLRRLEGVERVGMRADPEPQHRLAKSGGGRFRHERPPHIGREFERIERIKSSNETFRIGHEDRHDDDEDERDEPGDAGATFIEEGDQDEPRRR